MPNKKMNSDCDWTSDWTLTDTRPVWLFIYSGSWNRGAWMQIVKEIWSAVLHLFNTLASETECKIWNDWPFYPPSQEMSKTLVQNIEGCFQIRSKPSSLKVNQKLTKTKGDSSLLCSHCQFIEKSTHIFCSISGTTCTYEHVVYDAQLKHRLLC